MDMENAIYSHLQELSFSAEKPVVTVQDLAEALDVAPQTIRNHIHKLDGRPSVRQAEIGQAKVWWYDQTNVGSGVQIDWAINRAQHQAHQRVLAAKAEWLDNRQYLVETERSGDVSVRDRVAVVSNIETYLQRGSEGWITWLPNIHNNLQRMDRELYGHDDQDDIPDRLEEEEGNWNDYTLPEGTSLSDSDVEYYLYDIPCFEAPRGQRVIGLAEFMLSYHKTLVEDLRDEHRYIESGKVDVEVVEGHVPGTRELISFGDIVDEFVSSVYDIEW
jgi:DNA-binding transcriptional ArsR family regulator